ncbi:hypothetical protein GCM10022218_34760 [Sphingobacterium ginsenosidimutans]|uniref:Transposase n=1 Tax=Sphingobacterium ginsenosidimutans TaxID=687845 RepID=A0ABP8AAD1_9SPHI
MKEKTRFYFERFKAEAIQGLCEGKSLSPIDGVLVPLAKHRLESMTDGELANHPNEEKTPGNNNRRNGKTKKTVRGGSIRTLLGDIIAFRLLLCYFE